MSARMERIQEGLEAVPEADVRLRRLCRACAAEFDVSAAGVALIVIGEHRGTLGDSGGLAGTVEDLQYTLGEGPCLDAHRSGAPVGEPDLAATERWPSFTAAALDEGVRAVFAFPLQVGAARFGALDLYRTTRGVLSDEDFSDALLMAETANGLVLDMLAEAGPGDLPRAVSDLVDRRSSIHHAVGMVSVQLGVGVEDAHVALRARAYASGRSVADVAVEVVARRERFEP